MGTNQSLCRVTYVAPSGFRYEVTGDASSEAEAVRLADETLEYVERIGISDHLREDGITVRPPAHSRSNASSPRKPQQGSAS